MKKPKLRHYVVTEVIKYVVLAINENDACEKIMAVSVTGCCKTTNCSAELYKPLKRSHIKTT